MKILFFSDVHGSPESMEQLNSQIERLEPEQLVLLGDALYHGPRNSLRPDYAPQRTAALLNAHRDELIAVRGNCDCEVDQLLLEFPMMGEYSHLLLDGHRFFLTHGHHWNPQQLPPLPAGAVLAYGHTHLPQLARLPDGVISFNPGSLSLPKGGNPASFGFYEAGCLTVRDLESGSSFMELALE